MYLRSKIEDACVALFMPERPFALLPPPPPLDDTGMIIKEAANVLREHGWIQSALSSHDGRCVMGALFYAITGRDDHVPEGHPAVQRVIGYLGGHYRGDVERWNDMPGRKVEDVLSMLEHAARYVR